jgi:hypothetical protein
MTGIMPQELSLNHEAEILDECQKAIGYQFRQPELLRASLTYASGANTRLASNERMEFLGDSVLGLGADQWSDPALQCRLQARCRQA